MQAKLLLLFIGLAALVSTSVLQKRETASAGEEAGATEISLDDRPEKAA